MFSKVKEVFREGTSFRWFLLCVLISGLSYGLYKGMLDNFLVEVVHMGEMERGVTEFFRELPGVMLVLILAVFYMFSAETMFKAGAVIMLIGMGMHAVLPPTKVLATLAICTFALGEHIQIGMKSTLCLQYAKEGRGGNHRTLRAVDVCDNIDPLQPIARQLIRYLEATYRLNLVAKEVQTIWAALGIGEDIDDTTSHRVLTWLIDKVHLVEA